MNKLLALMILLNVKKKKKIVHSKEEVENRFFFLLLSPRRKQILIAKLGCTFKLNDAEPNKSAVAEGKKAVFGHISSTMPR